MIKDKSHDALGDNEEDEIKSNTNNINNSTLTLDNKDLSHVLKDKIDEDVDNLKLCNLE